MNWQYIIDNGQLVYQSETGDTPFRNWSLKKIRCNVSYYEKYPLEDIDLVICTMLSKHDGAMDENDIATILGFNVIDNFDISPKRYADVAELQLFRALVKPIFEWGLVKKEKNDNGHTLYSITELGELSIKNHEKYKFFHGEKILIENFGINAATIYDSDFFPFFAELDISTDITSQRRIEYCDVDVSLLENEDSELIKRMHLQSKTHYNIYQAEETNYFDIEAAKVDVKLYVLNDIFYPIIFRQDTICLQGTELLNNDSNVELKNRKIEWGLYLRLMNDETAALDYKAIFPFIDILQLDQIIPDKRVVWDDDRLFALFSESVNANQVSKISNYCPVDIIKRHINDTNIQWDWIVLSQRIDEFFIAENPLLEWDFEIISSREDVSIETIKTLLVIPELKDAEWNWDNIMPHLDFDFIKNNIQKVNFDLYELTKNNSNEIKSLVSQNTNCKWDWQYISDEYELDFILNNLLVFAYEQDGIQHNHLNLKTIIDRALSSPIYAEKYCASNVFKEILSANKASLSYYTSNTSNYYWSAQTISFLEETGFLTWESGVFTAGFECNPHIDWDKTFFDEYSCKVRTFRGFAHVSSKVKDPQIVINNREFCWNWECLSNNRYLIEDDTFVKTFIDKLSLPIVLPLFEGELIEELLSDYNLLELLSDNFNLWKITTSKVSVDFVRKHLTYNWDWTILTQRFYTTINIKAIGDERWVDKWDWIFLTKNLDWNIVFDNIDQYCEYWDWNYLTRKLNKEYIIDHLPEYASFWDWSYLIDSKLDKSDLTLTTYLIPVAMCISVQAEERQIELWKKITQKYDYNELIDLVHCTNSGISSSICKWDYEHLYSMPEFDIFDYLEDYVDDVKWNLLSKSSKLNEELIWDKTLYSKPRWIRNTRNLLKDTRYQWDFSELSKLESINSQIDIITIRTPEWDWHYLTAFSHLFDRGEMFKKAFYKFKDYIDFKALSSRQNTGVTKDLIQKNNGVDWDWFALSNNSSIRLDIDFIKKLSEKPWDWQSLSARTDIEIDNETLYGLIDKDWNWDLISSSPTIVYNEECLHNVISKPLNWFAVSQNCSFVPNQQTLSLLKGKELDWDAISDNPKLEESVLWDYKEKFNWHLVTRNKIDCTNLQLLEKFEDYIDWHYISSNNEFVLNTTNLIKFKSRLDWNVVNQRKDFLITNEIITGFADVIDWDKASQSMDINFTEELIEQYRTKWNWLLLRHNPAVLDKLDTILKKYIVEFNCTDFVERFNQTPYIYHFTHLFNAIEIIKSRKIKSRNLADGHFANAAGNLVDRRSTAHDYARFYYRPQTPTQFYNECLGLDSKSGYWKEWDYYGEHYRIWKSYYQQALNLGLPKCPMPVFFKFDLAEVVSKMPQKCYYSTGNMQTNWASIKKVSDNPNDLNTSYVYSTINDGIEKYKQYSQQEFLVLDEFDFSELHSFEIICFDDEQANILRTQLGDDAIVNKITTNGYNIFHRNNRKLNICDNGETITISSDYYGEAHFEIMTLDKSVIVSGNTNVLKETTDTISAYPTVEFLKKDIQIEVHFVDEKNRNWIIYKN